MTIVFETHNLDAAHDLLEQTYSRMVLKMTGDEQYMRLTTAGLGPIALDSTRFKMRFTADIAPLGFLPVGRTISGTTTLTSGADVTVSGPGDLFVAAQPDSGLHAESADHHGEYVRFPLSVFTQVASGVSGRRVRFTSHRPVSTGAAQRWHRLHDYVRDNIADASAAGPLVIGSAVRMLAAMALAAFPNTAVFEPTIEDSHDARPETLRRAIDYMEAHAGLDITPADIAAAARVTMRSLQLAFRRHLDSTPTAYLRRIRLERAHQQLLDADPATTTVAEVAGRWGFASHSSFTAYYHATYGTVPSATLRHQ